MTFRTLSVGLAAVLTAMLVACDPYGGERVSATTETGSAREEARAPEGPPPTDQVGAADPVDDAELKRLAQPARTESICRTFARKIAEAALEHRDDPEAFVAALTGEFVDGTDDPFELKAGLRENRWNQRYFYAGHGGFRPEFDDAQRYPRGGNHQPGHFISVLAIAARFGEEQARIAIAYAGDYDPGDEDDLRLSNVAIPLGAGLRDRSVSPAEVAARARELCRN